MKLMDEVQQWTEPGSGTIDNHTREYRGKVPVDIVDDMQWTKKSTWTSLEGAQEE